MKALGKRVLPLLMAMVMMLSLSAAAIISTAAETDPNNYTITLKPNEFTNLPTESDSTTTAERFEAYQLFSGRVDPAEHDGFDAQRLADARWGSGFTTGAKDAFVAELKVNKTVLEDGKTVGQVFTEGLDAYDKQAQDEAAAVAAILEDFADDSLLMQTFARIAGGHLDGTPVKSTWDGTNFIIKIPKEQQGYYIIVDTYLTKSDANLNGNPDPSESNDQNDEVSPYIIDVINDKEITLKSRVPTLDKKVKDDGKWTIVGDAQIGDYVQYKLTATLPENYDMFGIVSEDSYNKADSFYFAFHDTLSTGLDFVKDNPEYPWVIRVDNGEGNEEQWKTIASSSNPGQFELLGADGRELVWKCDNLKEITDVKFDSKIVLTYYAQLNKNGVVAEPNKNTAHLEYSNDPYGEGHGNTHEVEIPEYFFGLNILKVALDEDNTPVANAGFKVLNKDDKYATFTKEGDAYKLSGWDDAGTEIFTDDEGRLHVDGFDDVSSEDGTPITYTLKETTSPVGYETMYDIKFHFEATYSEDGMSVVSQKVVLDDRTERTDVDVTPEGTVTVGEFPVTLYEPLSPSLPKTGATTALICSLIAVTCIAGAAVFFVVYRRSKNRAK